MNARVHGLFPFFRLSIFVALIGAVAAAFVGFYYNGTVAGAFRVLFIAMVLGVLEVSLSLDNAVVDASILRQMEPRWRHRYLTWGIFIAVFGMRLFFPVLLVSAISHSGPIDAFMMAVQNPSGYAELMKSAHPSVAAFGGAFLLLVALKYFFERNKHYFWLTPIERPLRVLGRLETAKVAITLIVVYLFSLRQIASAQEAFLISGLWGTIVFMIVDGIGAFLHPVKASTVERAGLTSFIYLETLDASFSFDGVVGAFAVTNNLFIIMIGLGVGAMFVRSMAILLVQRGIVQEYRYLEHGAFYAIGVLSFIMFFGTVQKVPEAITGSVGLLLIGLSIWSSIRYNKSLRTRANLTDELS